MAALGSRVLQCNAVTLDVGSDRGASVCTDIAKVSDTAIQSLKSECPAVEWIVWASPLCDQYSRAHTCGTRDLQHADVLAKRIWKFIDILKPEQVLIEILRRPYCGSVTSCWRDQGPRSSWTIVSTGQRHKRRPCFGSNTLLQGYSAKTCPGPGKCPAIAPLTRRHIVSIDGGEVRETVAANPDRLVLELFQAVY